MLVYSVRLGNTTLEFDHLIKELVVNHSSTPQIDVDTFECRRLFYLYGCEMCLDFPDTK